jgi:propanediol utilization protein
VSNSNNQLSREYIENLFNVSFLSASHFSTLTGQQQAEAMGINVSSYDDRINTVKERAREIRAEIKAVGVLEPIREVSKVDIVSVQKERAAAVQFNLKQSDLIESQINIKP